MQKQNGAWKWSWWRDAYDHVLISWLEAKTNEARALVFQQEKEVVNAQLVKFINDISMSIARQGDIAIALQYNEAALDVCKILNDKEAHASALMHRAGFYLYQANYTLALETYQKALPLLTNVRRFTQR